MFNQALEAMGLVDAVWIDAAFGQISDPGPAWLVLRPEDIALSAAADGESGGTGVAYDFAYRRAGYADRITVPGLNEPLKAEVTATAAGPFAIGARVQMRWDMAACALLKRAPNE